MRRRELIRLVAAGVAGAPFCALAQPRIPVIGYLSSKGPAAEKTIIGPILDSLARAGFVDGRNLSILYRWSYGDYDRLPAQAADLVTRKVDLIITSGYPATLAAKAASSTIPIVFRLAVDPVASRLAASMNRPGGNLTGVTMLFDPLTPKKMELLHQLATNARSLGLLINPKNRNAASHKQHAEAAAQSLGLELVVLTASTVGEIAPAFAAGQQRVGAILVGDDPFFDVTKVELVSAAAKSGIPTMFYVRDFVDAGGLISYGPSFAEMAALVGDDAARILKGAKTSELPIGQPTRIELVINLSAAKGLGLTIPPALVARADEVIE